jgi:hypothetical protein
MLRSSAHSVGWLATNQTETMRIDRLRVILIEQSHVDTDEAGVVDQASRWTRQIESKEFLDASQWR